MNFAKLVLSIVLTSAAVAHAATLGSPLATSAAPSSPQTSLVEVGPSAGEVGYALGAVSELQRHCGHTVDKLRRVMRVANYLEDEMVSKGTTDMGKAFADGLKRANLEARHYIGHLSAAELNAACVNLNSDFEPRLEQAERNVPVTFTN